MRIIENTEPTTFDKEPMTQPKEEPKELKKSTVDPYKCFSDSLSDIAKKLYDLSFELNKISGAILNFGQHED